ncbi:hypothetical protein [Edaphobacter acidisoli]|uniref:hypothetical protein n=1 Tax=Edaphobacter acidisoli TaxID=2040573 RepID=UPI001666E4E6|nr:hypothetical protein [Edaphobacter acidisoli]
MAVKSSVHLGYEMEKPRACGLGAFYLYFFILADDGKLNRQVGRKNLCGGSGLIGFGWRFCEWICVILGA